MTRSASVLLLFLGASLAGAQSTTVDLPVPLLPQTVNNQPLSNASTGTDASQADAPNSAALTEDGLQRFAKGSYGHTQLIALQFNDVSGATAAFSLYQKAPGPKLDGAADATATADGRTVIRKQTVVLLAEPGADKSILTSLVPGLPRIGGPRSQPPLLPKWVPEKGLVQGSVRYAIGPAGYAALDAGLDAKKLGWEKSAEAVVARYDDRRGRETLTLLLYPTPQIAGDHLRAIDGQAASLPGLKTRREGELVIVATGTFSPDAAQNMVENIHLRQEATFDKAIEPSFEGEVHKTYSLLTSIILFSCFGALAAIILGFAFGGGRALLRVMRGKDAAAEVEFLSLHLANQNPRPHLESPPPGPPPAG